MFEFGCKSYQRTNKELGLLVELFLYTNDNNHSINVVKDYKKKGVDLIVSDKSISFGSSDDPEEAEDASSTDS